MNFFEHQEKARKKTSFLILLFIAAVIAIILAVYFAARLCMYFVMESGQGSAYLGQPVNFPIWDWQTFAIVCGIVALIVVGGTLQKISQISRGGMMIAAMMGGTLIKSNTTDPDEKKVLNIVEEMAIASGVGVPPVFILKKEIGINAFAAGFSTQDAVIGITKGAIKVLSRDELQGVIAHEFSHIFNGDMRLNMHLMGVLGGLMAMGMVAKIILRPRIYISRRRDGRAMAVIYLFAFLLLIIGYIGIFFCNLIKAAISKQREFLADASAVQYTRNPAGIAGALKKIGGIATHSMIEETRAEEMSHFFFANALKQRVSSAFNTHPPLEVRIKLLDPHFDGVFPKVKTYVETLSPEEKKKQKVKAFGEKSEKWEKKLGAFQMPVVMQAADHAVENIGNVNEEQLNRAAGLIGKIPPLLKKAADEPMESEILIYELLIERFNDEIKDKQIEYLKDRLDKEAFKTFLKLMPEFYLLKPHAFLPLIDLATPTLKTQSIEQYEFFRETIEALIHMDKNVSVSEFVLKQVVLHHLDFHFGKVTQAKENLKLHDLYMEAEMLLSYLSQSVTTAQARVKPAFFKAAQMLSSSHAWNFKPLNSLVATRVEEAMKRMQSATPLVKEMFLKSCQVCVMHDGKMDINELEVLRAFASALNCPIPPVIFDDQ